jgi:thioredoxin 1
MTPPLDSLFKKFTLLTYEALMSDVIEVDDNNFEVEVLGSKLPVLVDFSATWCGPCQRQLPIMEQFATANTGRVKVCKVDVDEAPAIAEKLKIRGVPSIILFNHGERLDMKVGLTTAAVLNNLLLEKVGT